MKRKHFHKQTDLKDCGPACLKMLAKHYGRSVSLEKLRTLSETTRTGTSLKKLSDAAETIGFRTLGVKVDFNGLKDEVPLPCIVHWQQRHFVIVYKIKKNKVFIADPAHGFINYSISEFLKQWVGPNSTSLEDKGIALIVEPTPRLNNNSEENKESARGIAFLYQYLFRYKKFLIQLIIGLVASSLLQLIFPFLTQSVVDVGIQNQDINFIYLILIAQLFLFIGRTGLEAIRRWILLHLSTRTNISLVSDFFLKLMQLPIAFFDTKMTGDILQRIDDHKRIDRFLTSSSLNVIFSVFNLIIFGFILILYDWRIFLIFFFGSLFYFLWVIIFLKKRKDLDYKRFAVMGEERSKVIELINGMQDIKLHNAEKEKRWSWEYVQARLFKISIKSLSLEQTQTIGSNFINELKNIIISFFSAKLVIDGEITLGMMLAISYITGQLNTPILQLINFIYSAQDAKISLERLSEIHEKENEENSDKIQDIELNSSFALKNVSFRYLGSPEAVIKNLSLQIPANKTTAIVGISGSGKTTLLKLLLKYYEAEEGSIKLDNVDLNQISQYTWRENCGVVMQEGYIFNDSIANNIAIGEGSINKDKLLKAVEVANIKTFIESLPQGYNTKIGLEGVGMSTGQKQRMLIARAVYKNPKFIFFDEATSALDANNEKQIMEKLTSFFEEKTVVIVAHRLSTVKNADQIVVLDEGRIIEQGNHDELVKLKGSYYNLVKNQLELGK